MKSADAGQGGPAKAGRRPVDGVTKTLLARALAAVAAGDQAGAKRLLEEAYRVSRRPEMLYQLGRLAMSAGRPVEAHDLVLRYLADPSREPDDEAVKTAEQLLSQPLPPRGSIIVLSDPGALVLVDGRVVGTLPLPLPLLVSAETHSIVLEFPGKKLEAPVQALTGRTIELRVSRSSGAMLVSVLPAILLCLESAELPPDSRKALSDALEQAVHGEQYTIMEVEAALLQAPELKECIAKEQEDCRRQLAEKNKLDFVMVQRTQLAGQAQDATWKMDLRLLRTSILDPASTAEISCAKCALDAAANRLKEATAKLLTEGFGRSYGQVRITAEPAAAMLRIGERAATRSPFETSLWAGSYELAVNHPGYQSERRTVEVTAGQRNEVSVALKQEETQAPPPPPPPPPQLRWETAPRPRWRLATGGVLLGLGVGLIGLGAVGVVRDGACIEPPALEAGACPELYNTLGASGAAIGLGAGLIIGGVVSLSLPGPRRQVLVKTPDSEATPAPSTKAVVSP